jgi:hypothetical protein
MKIEEREQQLEKERGEVRQKIEILQRQLASIESKLELIAELKGEGFNAPLILTNNSAKALLAADNLPSIHAVLTEGMKALRQFTKTDVIAWARLKYPKLQFSEKSIFRPLNDLIKNGEVKLIRKNQGSKTQAVYGFT